MRQNDYDLFCLLKAWILRPKDDASPKSINMTSFGPCEITPLSYQLLLLKVIENRAIPGVKNPLSCHAYFRKQEPTKTII